MASLSLFLSFSISSSEFPSEMTCFTNKQVLEINNSEVLNWKSKTQNQYQNRGHIKGVLLYTYPDKNGHDHYQVQIGDNNSDTIEVIYNQSFGAIPEVSNGATFEACGDYITSNRETQRYPASPDGAILHWVHKSLKEKSHDSGFLIINGIVYGLKTPKKGFFDIDEIFRQR